MERKILTTVSLELPTIETLDEYAASKRISRAEVIRIACKKFLESINLLNK